MLDNRVRSEARGLADQSQDTTAANPVADSVSATETVSAADSAPDSASVVESAAGLDGWIFFDWTALQERATELVVMSGPLLLLSAGVLLLAWVSQIAARWVLTRVKKKFAERTETVVDDYIVAFLQKGMRITILVGALMLVFRIWSLETPAVWAEATWIALIFVPGSRLASDMLALAEKPLVKRNPNLVTAAPLFNRTVRILVIALGLLFALAHAGLNIAPLLGGAGVMGLALSLAAKDTLSNLIAGVLLTIDRPFQVGDRIELWSAPTETGTWGDVIDIGLRATKIRNPDNLVVVVPNNEIMQRDIINYTMSGNDIRLRIPFSVAYESDVEKAKKVLIDTALKVKGVKPNPLPIVIVRGFGPSEINLQLRVWIVDARSRRRVADEITEHALTSFAEQGLEIPYPKRELYIHQAEGLRGPRKKTETPAPLPLPPD